MILKTYRKQMEFTEPDSTEKEAVFIHEMIDGIERVSDRTYGKKCQDIKHNYMECFTPRKDVESFTIDLEDENLISAFIMNDNGKTLKVLKK